MFEYCQIEGNDLYSDRVFEISARNALRRQLQDSDDSLEGTGFPPFIAALNTFLTKERAIAELRQARSLARQTHRRIHESVESRISLLSHNAELDMNLAFSRLATSAVEYGKSYKQTQATTE